MYNHFTGRVFNFLMTKNQTEIKSRTAFSNLCQNLLFDIFADFFLSISSSFFFHFLSATILAIVKQNFYNRKSLVNTIKRFRIQKENPLFFFNRNQKTWKTYRILCTRKEYIEYKKVRQVREEVLLFLFLQTNLSFDISFQKEY